ncbi:MAG: anti-sigma regulatory factor [FCB group bacterium]|nr:anti-sigma regulatory factor [FCB group bacterium]
MNEQSDLLAEVRIASFEDIVNARQVARETMAKMGFGLLDQTRIVTAVSELARNIMLHAKVGTMRIVESTQHGTENKGITCVFDDKGPGIKDLDGALREGFTSAGSLGLGLTGAKRLSDDFEITSTAGKGTTISISKWL